MGALVALVALGDISRVKARAPSADGRVEVVCRGWLPEPTEYGVWLRRHWQPWGTHLAQTGSESMGHCRAIVWTPDGRLVVAATSRAAARTDGGIRASLARTSSGASLVAMGQSEAT